MTKDLVKDSNVELIGSSADLAQRIAAAKTEQEWTGAGTKEGLEIWRVEDFAVKPVPHDKYGKFYDGDSYIVLCTEKSKDEKHEFSFNLHFWIGSKSSIDEQGVAAYKTTELDDFLNTRPVQYREVQGSESSLFLSYFKNGVKIMIGGVKSGFKHVEKVASQEAPRLVRLKGKIVVQSAEVPAHASSLNHGDAFVLDAGNKVYVWRGNKSKPTERYAAVQYAETVRTEHEGRAEIVTLDDSGSDEFWKLLNGSLADVKSAEEGGDDALVKGKVHKLIRLHDNSGKLEMEQVAEGKITMEMFKSEDVFFLDTASFLFVWVGKLASPAERKFSLSRAMNYIKSNNIQDGVPVQRVLEGEETEAFKIALK